MDWVQQVPDFLGPSSRSVRYYVLQRNLVNLLDVTIHMVVKYIVI